MIISRFDCGFILVMKVLMFVMCFSMFFLVSLCSVWLIVMCVMLNCVVRLSLDGMWLLGC